MNAFFPYAEETRGIVVRVSVQFLPEQSAPGQGRWFWAYHVRVENASAVAVQLMSRRWVIADGRGARHQVEGDGVVGDQPVIAPGAAYDYVSGCPLNTPSGSMRGSYRMVAEDGSSFDIAIPKFALTAPVAAG